MFPLQTHLHWVTFLSSFDRLPHIMLCDNISIYKRYRTCWMILSSLLEQPNIRCSCEICFENFYSIFLTLLLAWSSGLFSRDLIWFYNNKNESRVAEMKLIQMNFLNTNLDMYFFKVPLISRLLASTVISSTLKW